MADVTMTVAEHDQLRNRISTLEKDKQDLINSLPRVIVENKGYDIGFSLNNRSTSGYNFTLKGLQCQYQRDGHPELKEITCSTDLDFLAKTGLVQVSLYPNSKKDNVTYQNLDKTVQQMTETFEARYTERLKKAEERATNAEIIASKIEDKYQKEIVSIHEKHKKEISVLKGEIEEETKTSLIESLRNELEIANQTIESLKNPVKSKKKRFLGII